MPLPPSRRGRRLPETAEAPPPPGAALRSSAPEGRGRGGFIPAPDWGPPRCVFFGPNRPPFFFSPVVFDVQLWGGEVSVSFFNRPPPFQPPGPPLQGSLGKALLTAPLAPNGSFEPRLIASEPLASLGIGSPPDAHCGGKAEHENGQNTQWPRDGGGCLFGQTSNLELSLRSVRVASWDVAGCAMAWCCPPPPLPPHRVAAVAIVALRANHRGADLPKGQSNVPIHGRAGVARLVP